MEHPAGQAASAATPDRSNAAKNDDNATAARLLPREEDTQGAPCSAAQPAASSKETPTEEQTTPSDSAKVGGSAGKPAQQPQLAIKRDV